MKSEMKRLLLTLSLCLICFASFAQHDIKGNVKDSSGEPLIGVTVSVDGKTETVTDVNGNFTLPHVLPSSVIKVTYVGFESQEQKAGNRTHYNIIMRSGYQSLNEVVVVGYGAVKKRDLVGSISSIKAKDITAVPSTNVLESMQGKIAGLDMTRSSGAVGSGFNFNVRGNRSLTASNAPLILVDGIAYGSDVTVNPNDIESIEVLKDASTTAIYGSRGANGVIMITTKKGSKGKTRVDMNMYCGPVYSTNLPKLMNTKEYVAFRREAMKAVGKWSSEADDASIWDSESLTRIHNNVNTDWLDLVMQSAFTQNYQVSVNGGTETTQVSASMDYLKETGLLKGDDMKRYDGRLNIVQKINRNMEAGASVLYSYRQQFASPSGIYHYAQVYDPYGVPYNDDGSINEHPFTGSGSTSLNPLLDQSRDNYEDETIANRLFGTAYFNWTIIKGLTYRTNLGVDVQNNREGVFEGINSSYATGNSGLAFASKDETHNNSYTWENTLTYSRDFGIHSLTAMLGHSMSKSHYEDTYASGKGYSFEEGLFHNLDGAQKDYKISSSLTETSILSYFTRLNYKLLDRYLFTFTLRADGSSVLAEGNKWGYFPSMAAAWRIKDETFLKDINAISDLKIRLSYGLSGNSAVSAYQTSGGLSETFYDFEGTAAYGYRPYLLANHDLKWEKTRVLNFGVDFGLIKNRIYATVDAYKTWTSDLLLPMIVPGHTGFTSVISNVGKTETRGIDITVNTVNFDTPKFKWNTTFTFTANKEKITSINSDQDDIANGWFIGQPTRVFYDYEKIGIWQTNEADEAAKYGQVPGDIKVKDQNGDGKITATDDRKIIGQQTPKWTAGLNNSFQYDDFELSFFLYARVGQTICNYANLAFYPSGWVNQPACDYWTETNPTNAFPRPNFNHDQKMLYFSTLGYEKGDFLKIKDITLAYNVPAVILQHTGLSKLRLYATMKNYFTFCHQSNYDPERGGAMSYPLTKELVFGINVSF
jgi:TonB-linked SusC/RagA family outer membrane protein